MEANIAGNRSSRAAELKRQIQNAERATVPFRLVHTGDGSIVVDVQRPSFTYLVSMGIVPQAFRTIVDNQIRRFGRSAAAKGNFSISDAEAEKMLQDHGLDMLTFMDDLRDATVIAGFVNPPITKDRAIADDPNSEYVWLETIDVRDRDAFYAWCNAQTEAEAEAVKSDDGFESAVVPVGAAPDGEGVRLATIVDQPGAVVGSRVDEV